MSRKRILFFKQAALFVAACVILVCYFSVDAQYRWFYGKLGTFKKELVAEYNHTDVDERYRVRFGTAYDFMLYVKNYVDSTRTEEPLILLPTAEYMTAHNFKTMVPEPIVYYYFTGYKCVTANSKEVANANYAIFMKEGSPAITRLRRREDVPSVLEHYKTKPQPRK